MSDKNYFEVLNNINVSGKTEKKNGLTYLSWSYAWGELKKIHPDAFYTIYENEQGWPYNTDGKTGWVKTGVTVNGIEHIEYLPIMDYKNKSIPVDSITSFDVNKTIQRSLTKAVARHGLGLYVFAGEDLPEEERVEEQKAKVEIISKTEVEVLKKLCEKKGQPSSGFKGKKLEQLTGEDYAEAVRMLNAMPDKESA